MNILGVIPARFASSRFPGKPLADIKGKPMIQRVYERCQQARSLNKIVVATDDIRIFEAVLSFGGEAVMTSADHQSGTDRCREALQKQPGVFDAVVNIQGDEPAIHPEQIDQLADMLQQQRFEIATLAHPVSAETELFNPNVVKVVCSEQGKALYFSRSPIPFLRGAAEAEWLKNFHYLRHVGMYAYLAPVLEQIAELSLSPLEKAESLEQLRWLENGYNIGVGITYQLNVGVDTPEDLEKIWNFF